MKLKDLTLVTTVKLHGNKEILEYRIEVMQNCGKKELKTFSWQKVKKENQL